MNGPQLDLKFQVGTCYSRRECREKNGTAVAQCAQGYGVCCICKYLFIIEQLQYKDTYQLPTIDGQIATVSYQTLFLLIPSVGS